jgi:hypothetical protein
MSELPSSEVKVVGRYYRVPSVYVKDFHDFIGWLPILGPRHEDAEIVAFPWQHFHVDWRFAPAKLCRRLSWRGPEYVLAYPLQCPDSRGAKVIVEGPTLQRMKMKRPQFQFPDNGGWVDRLRRHHACDKIVQGRCPHRGLPVEAMHREGDILTCPGHGLRFNALTGEALQA